MAWKIAAGVLLIGFTLSRAIAGGPAPAETLAEAHPFDFPPVPEGLSSQEYFKGYVGKGLHRLYDLVALGEYELADAHWEKLMAYKTAIVSGA